MRREADAILSLQRFIGAILREPWDIRTELEPGEPPDRPFALIEQAGSAETTGAPNAQQVTVPMVANLYLERHDSRQEATDAALALRELVWQAVKWGPDPRRPTTDRIALYAYTPREERHRFKVTGATSGTFNVTVGTADAGAIDFDTDAAGLAAAIEAALIADGQRVDPGDVVGYDRGAGLWDVHYTGRLAGQRPGDPVVDGAGLLGGTLLAVAADARVLLEGTPAPWRGPSDFMRVESFNQNTVRDQADPSLVMVAVDLRLTFVRGRPLPLDHRVLQRIQARP